MSRIFLVVCVAFFGSSSAYSAPVDTAMPTFRDIEYRYTGDEALDAGRAAITQSIPIGMPLNAAQQLLHDAGARCKPMKRDPQTTRCVYNDLTIVDEVVADIQWKALLHTADDRITSVSVDRYVDRKGTAD